MSKLLKAAAFAIGIAGLVGASSASAGEYWGGDGGYYGHHHHSTYRYTSCCYERIVKYRRVYSEHHYDQPYRHSYYEPPRYGGGYYGARVYGYGPRNYYYGD